MIGFVVFAVVLSSGCAAFLYRNKVTLRVRLEALDLVSAEADRRIAEERFDEWRSLYDRLESTSYDRTLFSLAMTPLEAFPWLAEEIRGELW